MEDFKNKYTEVELVEKNDFADVYIATNNETQQKVSIKVLRSQSNNSKYIDDITYEIDKLKDLKHENLIGINEISSFVEENVTYYYIETEYFRGRSIWNKVVFEKHTYRQSLEIIKQILEGLKEFHYIGLNYETLNAENVFINQEGIVKIDVLSYIQQKYDELEGASYNDEFDEGIDKDIYAVGLILYKLITRDNNFKINKLKKNIYDEDLYSIIYSLTTKKLDYRYENLNEILVDVSLCLDKLPLDVEHDSEEVADEFIDDFEEDNGVSNRSSLIKKLGACVAVLLVVFIGVKGIASLNKDDSKTKEPTNIVKEEEPKEEEVLEDETEVVAEAPEVEQSNIDTYTNDDNSETNINRSNNNYNNNQVERPSYNNNNNNTNSNTNSNVNNGTNNNHNTNNSTNHGNNNNHNGNNNNTVTPPVDNDDNSNQGQGDSNTGGEETPKPHPDPTPDQDDEGQSGESVPNSEVNQEIE